MIAVITVVGIVAALAVGVGLLLYSDHKQHQRMIQNGGRRY